MSQPSETRFQWDPRKAEINKRKHGVAFELAVRVFNDPLVDVKMEGHEHGEVRWQAMGEIAGKLLRVTYTTCEEGNVEFIRIISARKATPTERRD